LLCRDLPSLACCSVLDEMGRKVDDLERNIADLMTHAGIDDHSPD